MTAHDVAMDAPVQYTMLQSEKKIDWDYWLKVAQKPEVYDPPQLKGDYFREFFPFPCCPKWKAWYMNCNWYLHRSPLCRQPALPCCGLQMCMASCCNPTYNVVPLADADHMFRKMLSVCHPECPDFLRGVWWMKDNIAAEVLLTFQDAQWSSGTYAEKRNCYNWTRDPTLFGTVLQTFTSMTNPFLSFEISPDGKWIAIQEQSSANLAAMWMYVIQPGDKFVLSDGSNLEVEPGDMMRVNYENPLDPRSRIKYQYIVRRVAILDDSGKLVKTRGYDQLLQQASKQPAHRGVCCDYCLFNLTADQVADCASDLNTHTAIRYSWGQKA
eukprot:TRINITY_DN11503_c1_g4_i1.p1 TRINITY_DN11503_c1_g4~~TRINITY_DN11503_c1_g4_i1.p1  ORF type:complete len:326 (-),score=45.68 TRINITY_DN11503_c1_g4_i1:121-1098(-)